MTVFYKILTESGRFWVDRRRFRDLTIFDRIWQILSRSAQIMVFSHFWSNLADSGPIGADFDIWPFSTESGRFLADRRRFWYFVIFLSNLTGLIISKINTASCLWNHKCCIWITSLATQRCRDPRNIEPKYTA